MTYLLLASIVLAIIATWMRGGKMSRLGEVEFRLWWTVPLITVVQSLVVRFSDSPSRLNLWHPRPLIMIVSYVVLWAVVWRNRHLPGMLTVLLGVTLNLLVIAANGGYMPVSPKALARIGMGDAAQQMPVGSVVMGSKDVLLPSEQARFSMLGDVLVIPEPLPWSTAMSIGDCALAVGIFWFIVRTARQPSRHLFSEHPDRFLVRSGKRSEASHS
jgi:hypothetical protein